MQGDEQMSRRAALHTVLFAALLVLPPSTAFALEEGAVTIERGDVLAVGAGALTLVASVVLLVIALLLERVARGSAMAENISFVVLACVCLAASVLAQWAGHFMTDTFSGAQAALGADLLITVAIVFLSVYFCRVRGALTRFIKGAAQAEDVMAGTHITGDTPNG
jgi:hypothetical protein